MEISTAQPMDGSYGSERTLLFLLSLQVMHLVDCR